MYIIDAIMKSRKAAIIDASGRISLGKYIFVTKLILFTRLGTAKVIDEAKNVHGNSAVYEKIGYGYPSDGIPAKSENIIVKTTIKTNGWRIAQITPKKVCL